MCLVPFCSRYLFSGLTRQVKDLAVKPKSEPKIFAAPSSVPPPLVTAEGLQRSGSSAILAASGNAGSAESESPQRRRSLGSKVFGNLAF